MTGLATHSDERHGRGARATGFLPVLFAGCAMVVVCALIWVAVLVSHDSATPRLGNPPGMVDRLDFFDTAAAWSSGKRDHAEILADRLVLADSRGQYPRIGIWTGRETRTDFGFTELLPSYNPDCPVDTGLRLDVRTRDGRSGEWSNWFYLGCWGRTVGKEDRQTRSDFGRVDIDWLALRRPADAYQARITFYAYNLAERTNPSLRRLAVCYSGVVGDARRREDLVTPVAFEHLPSARDIPVPFRAQGSAAKPLRPEICSPTSVSMVLQYLGFDRPTEENALGIYDAEYDLFGNWSRAVAWAGQNGFDGWLTRFRNWDQVRATLASGQPIIASIRFKKGQCPSFVMSETAGHLIVIRGFTSGGDFIVNDPASKDKGNGAVYKAADLSKAWLDHGGVGYILRKPHT